MYTYHPYKELYNMINTFKILRYNSFETDPENGMETGGQVYIDP